MCTSSDCAVIISRLLRPPSVPQLCPCHAYMESAQGGDLFSALRSNVHGSGAAHPLSWWRHGRSIALDIARGLHFLHSQHVVHAHAMIKSCQLH